MSILIHDVNLPKPHHIDTYHVDCDKDEKGKVIVWDYSLKNKIASAEEYELSRIEKELHGKPPEEQLFIIQTIANYKEPLGLKWLKGEV